MGTHVDVDLVLLMRIHDGWMDGRKGGWWRRERERRRVRSPKSMTVESPQAVKRGVSTSVQQYSSTAIYITVVYSMYSTFNNIYYRLNK
jgi:hypothetical protein